MKAEDTINRIRGALGGHLAGFEQKSENRVYVEIRPETVIEAGQLMFEEIGARLQICTGIDTGQGIEVMYHWALDTEDCVVTVRVTVPYEAPVLASIANFCPAAEWIEREMWELLGIEFVHHPDLRHLLLDDRGSRHHHLGKGCFGLGIMHTMDRGHHAWQNQEWRFVCRQ